MKEHYEMKGKNGYLAVRACHMDPEVQQSLMISHHQEYSCPLTAIYFDKIKLLYSSYLPVVDFQIA